MNPLRSSKIYWTEDSDIPDIIKKFDSGVEEVSPKEIEHLVRELDRRLVQLWEKIDYENSK